ncbi:dihydropyrimidinase-like 4 [Cichlidogyrus casuarinus]|uniref:dihydropyrimidinase n=1 Tax=Cichlidogyrus casuarinus TaxID=1844966 RepID=A0ABD2QDK6_9PLAT
MCHLLQKAAERLLLHNVSLANSDNLQNSLSILIEEGKIIVIRETAIEVPEATQKIDCAGQYCLPGLVDFNTHLLWQSHDPTFGILKEISQHAVKTGTTTIAETLICPPNVCPYEMVARFKQAIQAVENLFWCDVVIRLGLCHLDEATIDEKLPRIVTELGVSSFMVGPYLAVAITFFISVDESGKQVDGTKPELLEKALQKCLELGAIALCKWDGQPQSNAVAAKSKSEQAMIQLATCHAVAKIVASTDCPTVMLGLDSVPAIQYLSKVVNQLPKVPIRYTLSVEPFVNEDQSAYNMLVAELANTNFVGVTSDQTALVSSGGYTLSQRATKLWKSLMVDGLADLPSFVKVASTEAAKLLGLYPAKGKIAVGADADLVLWAQDTLQNAGAEEVQQEVMPSLVIMAGEVVARDGQVVGASPGGIIYSAKIMPAIPYEQLRSIKQVRHELIPSSAS